MQNMIVRKLELGEMDNWNEFVNTSPQGSIFCKSYWLDAVGAEYYILGCFDKGERLLGGIPIVKSKPNEITMPKLTQTLGIVLDDFNEMKYVKRISKEKDIILDLVENMPDFKFFDYSFHYNFTNWMPFMWNKYSQTSSYTYVIEDISDINKVKTELSDKTKSIINKSVKSNLKVVNNLTLKDMYNMIEKTFSRQDMNVPFSYEWFNSFDNVLKEKSARQMFFALDEDNNLHAALYLVYDAKSAYYLLGGGDPQYRNSGAMYLNVFEAIKYASNYTNVFDFEGSVIPSIEHMFRSFGGKQKQYFRITKDKAILHNINQDIRKYGKIILKKI